MKESASVTETEETSGERGPWDLGKQDDKLLSRGALKTRMLYSEARKILGQLSI